MGRTKLNKPRRPRAPRGTEYSLQELRPPGELYDEWFRIAQTGREWKPSADPRLGPDARLLLDRFGPLGRRYGGNVPLAAVVLDQMIDADRLVLSRDGGPPQRVPLDAPNPWVPTGAASDMVRDALHELHAAGMLLVVGSGDGDDAWASACVRFVARKPERPGEPWVFAGAPEAAEIPSVCLPQQAAEELPPDILNAVAFLRSCAANGEVPDPREYGRHVDVRGPEHARELFAAAEATGWVDHKGCAACPAGHLCTRDD
ncbi:hypothetical protein [Streptomyces sp. NPDC090025]|uniref:hypothetical protein n=1 Tax=Streptomyces sp. NPDC090025 TaxID=3365922 RepID=UPI003838EE62